MMVPHGKNNQAPPLFPADRSPTRPTTELLPLLPLVMMEYRCQFLGLICIATVVWCNGALPPKKTAASF
jgi:hypothetical protein